MAKIRTRPFDRTMIGKYAYTGLVANPGKCSIGLADYGIPGYTPCPQLGRFTTYELAEAKATELNKGQGLDDLTAWKIVASTM
jgi:hypothetical protein